MALVVDSFRDGDEVLSGEFHVFGVATVHVAADKPTQIFAEGFPVDPAPVAVAA
jgi:hypothetical protein